MSKFLNRSSTWALSIITIIFLFVPEAFFGKHKLKGDASAEVNVLINRILTFLAVFIIVIIVYITLRCIRRSIYIKGHGYSVNVEYGDIFKKDGCKRVIDFDECFTTNVGDKPSDVKSGSICGQYLVSNPIHNMRGLIDKAQLNPVDSKSRYQSKERYESGKLVPNGDYLLMAFAKLDEDGLGCLTRDEFLDCLKILWKEIDKYYGQKDVCIPILGSGLTRFEDKQLAKQELLEIIVESYKLSSHKIKPPYQLHIICKKSKDFSINKIGINL